MVTCDHSKPRLACSVHPNRWRLSRAAQLVIHLPSHLQEMASTTTRTEILGSATAASARRAGTASMVTDAMTIAGIMTATIGRANAKNVKPSVHLRRAAAAAAARTAVRTVKTLGAHAAGRALRAQRTPKQNDRGLTTNVPRRQLPAGGLASRRRTELKVRPLSAGLVHIGFVWCTLTNCEPWPCVRVSHNSPRLFFAAKRILGILM